MSRWLCIAIVPLLAAVPASAGVKEALGVVPSDALGFVIVKDLGGLSAKMKALAKKLKASKYVSVLELIKQGAGIGKGLDKKGSAVFIVMKWKKGDKGKGDALPDFVLALSAADHEAVFTQLGIKGAAEGKVYEGEVALPPTLDWLAEVSDGPEDKKEAPKGPKEKVLAARKGKFVLLAPPEMKGVIEKVVAAKEGIAGGVEAAREWLGEQDICGVCTEHGVKVGLGLFVANPFLAAGSTSPEQAKAMKAFIADAEKNIRFVAFGGHISDEGHSRLLTRLYFTPKGAYAKWVAKAEPAREALLGRWPREGYIMAFLMRLSPQVGLAAATHLLPAKLPAGKAKELEKEAKRLAEQVVEVALVTSKPAGGEKRSVSVVAPIPLMGASIISPLDASSFAALVKVKDARAFVGGAASLVADAQTAGLGKGKVEAKKARVGGKEAALVPLPGGLLILGPRTELRELKEGKPAGKDGGKPSLLLVALDKETVLAGFLAEGQKPDALVGRLVKAKDASVASDGQLKKTRALLPGKLQMAAFLNLKGFVDVFFIPGLGWLAFPDAPPLAVAMRAFDGGVEAQFLLPFDTLRGFFEMVRKGPEKRKPDAKSLKE